MSEPNKTRLGNLGKDYGAVSKSIEWGTPPHIFKQLDNEFDFTIDVAASNELHVCDRYFTKADNGLEQSWAGERCYMNPPYGRDIADWVEKANYETMDQCPLVVALLPVRADTRWFHNHILPNAEIRFIKGRLKFGGFKAGAAFASMIVIWQNRDIQPVGLSGFDEVSSLVQTTLEEQEARDRQEWDQRYEGD